MSAHLHLAAVAAALIAATVTADAQTVITREITTEPVETIVERGPASTVITRRPLDMTVPRAPITLPDETSEPIAIGRSRETVGVSTASTSEEDVIVTRRRVQRPVAPQRVRAVTVQRQVRAAPRIQPVRRAAARPAVSTIRTTTGLAPAVRTTLAPPPPLTSAQRSTIYRTIVQQRVVPRTIVTERSVTAPVYAAPLVTTPAVRQEVITERVVAPPAPIFGERVVTSPVVTSPAVTSPYVVETVGAAPMVTERVVTRPAGVELTIGSRVPATLPLYALPAALGLQLPMIRPYRYAIVEDRVLLVDPATGLVVEEIER
jgi:hypothetical protein